MIDATHIKAHRTAASSCKKGASPRHIGRTCGGLNLKLHVLYNHQGKPIRLYLSTGQVSDSKGANIPLPKPPHKTAYLVEDRGYNYYHIPYL